MPPKRARNFVQRLDKKKSQKGRNGTGAAKTRLGRPRGKADQRSADLLKSLGDRLQLGAEFTSYREMSEALSRRAGIHVGHAVLQRYAQGIEPARGDLRAALGLPLLQPAPVCPIHGVVHSRQCRPVPAWVSIAADFLAMREKARND